MNASPRLPVLVRVLSAMIAGYDAEVVRGDLEETCRLRIAATGPSWRVRLACTADALLSLLHWWSPGATWRRRGQSHRAPVGGKMTTIGHDLRHILRGLRRHPGYAATVAVTLGLGIGATSTIYSVLDGMLLRPLPYHGSDRLILVGNTVPGHEWLEGREGVQRLEAISLEGFNALRVRVQGIEAAAAIERRAWLFSSPDRGPEILEVANVERGFFDLLSVKPLMGRLPRDGDQAGTGGSWGAAITYAGWQHRFGGDPGVVGRHYGPFTIVGVLGREFVQPAALVGTDVEFWIPLDPTDPRYAGRRRRDLQVLARMAPSISVEGLRRELTAAQVGLARDFPDDFTLGDGRTLGAGLNSLRDATVGLGARPFLIFLAAALLLLLLAGTNAANLLIVRGLEREGELSIRRALGAGRGRLAANVIGESLILALAGGAIGLAIAVGGVDAFRRFGPQTLQGIGEVAVNMRIVLAGALLSLVVGLSVGLLPAIRSRGTDLLSSLRSSAAVLSPPGTRLRTALAATQLALALVLGIGASLLFRSFLQLRAEPLGFQPDGLVSFSVLFKNDHPWVTWDQVLQIVRGVPGVTAAVGASDLPFQTPTMRRHLLPPGQVADAPLEPASGYAVSPGFFDTAKIPLLHGRAFDASDRSESRPVVIVNESFARSAFGDRDPIGQTLRDGDEPQGGDFEVVGMVGDVVQARTEDGMRPAVYFPYTQSPALLQVLAATHRDGASVTREVGRALAAAGLIFPVTNQSPMDDLVAKSRAGPRFQLLLMVAFAVVAVLLAALGLYGTLAFTVRSRLREIGIRMAMGATERQIFALVLRQGLAVLAMGLTGGVLAALVVTHLMQAFLYRVRPVDALSFLAALAILTVAVLVAALRPARRAARVDPVTSLRAEG